MEQVQASDAKARFAELLDQVERGESVVITRHGKSVARLVPNPDERQAEIDTAIKAIRTMGKQNGKITVEEILSARDEGRKY